VAFFHPPHPTPDTRAYGMSGVGGGKEIGVSLIPELLYDGL